MKEAEPLRRLVTNDDLHSLRILAPGQPANPE